MTISSTTFRERRARNAKILAQYSVKIADGADSRYRTVREGQGKSVFTVGYERRTGEDLISALKDAGITILVDVRDRPFSRKPDFREKALRVLCSEANIEYQSWTDLGSTEEQRDKLKATGDFSQFEAAFRKHAERKLTAPIGKLARLIQATSASVALLCYERCHDECHRSILGEMLADNHGIGVVAIC